MVIFEAARAITELNGVTSRELTPAITVLQLFLSSSKPVLRFAAVRTLNKVSLRQLLKFLAEVIFNNPLKRPLYRISILFFLSMIWTS
jgi:hypothetical protein